MKKVRRNVSVTMVCCLVVLIGFPAFSGTLVWDNSSGNQDWYEPTNWNTDTAAPNGGDYVYLQWGRPTANIASGTANVFLLQVGGNAANSNSLSVSGSASLNTTRGGGYGIEIGYSAGSEGLISTSNTAQINLGTGKGAYFYGISVGTSGTGTLSMTDSSKLYSNANSNSGMAIGTNASGVGVVNMSGDSAIYLKGSASVGRNGNGTINMYDNSYLGLDTWTNATSASQFLVLGHYGGSGILNMNGGTIELVNNNAGGSASLIIGNAGTGSLNMNAGYIDIQNTLSVGNNDAVAASALVSGGLIEAADLYIGSLGQLTVSNTGVIKLAGNDLTDVNAYIQSGQLLGSAYYDSVNDLTVIVPEPATITMLGIGGLISVLRKRRS